MQSYPLDLKTLIHILSRQKQDGSLHAKRVRLPGSKEVMQAHLTLINGTIQTCVILTKSGKSYAEGSKAVNILMDLGVFDWEWEESKASSIRLAPGSTSTAGPITPPPGLYSNPITPNPEQNLRMNSRSSSAEYGPNSDSRWSLPNQFSPHSEPLPIQKQGSSFTPRRIRQMTYEELNTLPRSVRRLWVLIDGGRPIEHIAAMLSTKEQEELHKNLYEMQRAGMIMIEA